MDIYREQLLDHYHRPRGWGLVVNSGPTVTINNPICGDVVHVQLEVERATITAMHFEGHGCVISRAVASLLSDAVVGQSVVTLQQWGLPDVEKLLGTSVQPARVACALLALSAVKQSLNQ